MPPKGNFPTNKIQTYPTITTKGRGRDFLYLVSGQIYIVETIPFAQTDYGGRRSNLNPPKTYFIRLHIVTSATPLGVCFLLIKYDST